MITGHGAVRWPMELAAPLVPLLFCGFLLAYSIQVNVSDDTVRAMRARFDAGARILDVALEFGVNYRTTQYILNRINYRYVA
jgi:hypothetical protein